MQLHVLHAATQQMPSAVPQLEQLKVKDIVCAKTHVFSGSGTLKDCMFQLTIFPLIFELAWFQIVTSCRQVVASMQ